MVSGRWVGGSWSVVLIKPVKGTVMEIEKALINDRLRLIGVSRVS